MPCRSLVLILFNSYILFSPDSHLHYCQPADSFVSS